MTQVIDDNVNGAKAPRGWAFRPLGEIADITMGNSPPGDSYNEDGEGVPLVNGPVEFSEGAFGLTVRTKFTTAPTKMCKAGDFLICVRGSTTGRTNIAAFDACIGRGVAAIRARMNQQYANHFVRTLEKRIHASGKGSTFPSISQQQLSDLLIPVPYADDPRKSVTEQKRLAEILDKADAIRRKRHEITAQLIDLEKSLFEESFAPSVEGHDQWPVTSLDDVLFFQEGPGVRKWQFTDAGVKLLNVGNIVNGRLQLSNTERYLSEEEAFGKYQHFLAQAGDLVMATSGVTWGKTAWVEEEHLPLCMNTSTVRFRPLDEKRITKSYMHAFLKSRFFTRQVDRLVTGSAQPNFGPSHLKKVQIVIPDIESQLTYEQKLQQYSQISFKHQCASEDANDLFNSLVQRAFKGEL